MTFCSTPTHRIAALLCGAILLPLFLAQEAPALQAPLAAAPGTPAATPYDSPRLAALARELAAGNRGALDAFWREMKGKAPLVERVAGSDRERWITYLWRGDEKTERVSMVGDLPTTDSSRWQLRRLIGTDLWYKSERIPR